MIAARVVCHECAHWYVYSEQEHDWSQLPDPPRMIGTVSPRTWTVKIKCDQPNCASLTRWHIEDDSGAHADEIVRKVFGAVPEIVCEYGHSLLAVPIANLGADYY
jgi:hypothetical protein